MKIIIFVTHVDMVITVIECITERSRSVRSVVGRRSDKAVELVGNTRDCVTQFGDISFVLLVTFVRLRRWLT